MFNTGLLPEDIFDCAKLYWAPSQTCVIEDPFESAIVTACFDLRRDDWRAAGGAGSEYRRSMDQYLGWFEALAALKNAFVVVTEPALAAPVLEARRRHGLEQRTAILTVERLFEAEPVARAVAAASQRMTPRFRQWLLHPEYPEFREPKYPVLMALKGAFARAGLRSGAVKARQWAWVDFGYCRDPQCFDARKPWRFDAGEKMNLFCVSELDDRPIASVVRFGQPYLQGGFVVGPEAAWPSFASELARAFDALLSCDLVDDDQTLMLMALRRDPSRYTVHGVSRDDWRAHFRLFNCDVPRVATRPRPTAMAGARSSFDEELRIALKRMEWGVKRWRARLGFP